MLGPNPTPKLSEASPAAPVKGTGEQFLTIQALRFLAALLVVVLHSTFYTSERLSDGVPLYASGANGVRLFFVISGFVMIFASAGMERTRRGWAVFAAKRVVRIVPMYWLATLVKLLTLLVIPSAVLHASLDWTYVVKSFFFIPATNMDGEIHPLLGVGWTLIFEMFFYCVFSLSLMLRIRPVAFVSVVLVILTGCSLLKNDSWPDAARFFANPIVLDFLAGMLIALWCSAGRQLPSLLGGALCCLVGLGYLFVPIPKLPHDSLVGSLFTTLAASSVILGAVALEPLLKKRIPRSILFLGAASYAIYLFHPLCAPAVPAALARLGMAWPYPAVLGSIAVALAVGSVCYVLVERPLTATLNSWAKRNGFYNAAGSRLPQSTGPKEAST